METVIDTRWKGRRGARLHVAPEGLTLVDDSGSVVGTYGYEAVTRVYAGREGRRSLLTVEFAEGPAWRLDGLHALQARFATELIQEQLSALHRLSLPAF